ncbi:MAG TPA: MBL fold metallo-hydrolase [Thermoplasmata archaeon]|nr:MBL fold metallo-hydrolase [Thermoplasmata archaeon]
MPVNSILVAHTSLDAKALNGGRKPKLSGDVLDVTLFDVADGEAIVVRKETRGLLIDGGSGSKTNDNGQEAQRLVARLPRGLKLDAIIASHPHRDHTNFYPYIARDAPELLRQGAVYYDNGTAPANNHWATIEREKSRKLRLSCQSVTARASLETPWAGTLLRTRKGKDVAYWSVFLALQHRQAWLLFTGDAKKSYEEDLLPDLVSITPRIHVLKITHHGSSTGTSAKLVARLNPSIAVASCAKDSGHRLEDDVRTVRLHAAKVYATYEQWKEEGRPPPPRRGDLIVRTDGRARKIGGMRGVLFEVETSW